MADYRAVPAVTEAVIELLQADYLAAPQFFNNELEFKIYLAKDFTQPMAAGVSLFLYRIYPTVPSAHRAGGLVQRGSNTAISCRSICISF
jgi:hypothetical protein